MPVPAAIMTVDETSARQVLLVQAAEAAPEGPLWTTDDAAWATRLALQSAGADAPPERAIAERARHALQRLLPRDPSASRWLAHRGWRPVWLALAVAVGLLAGVVADSLGGGRHINLLAPPVWGVIAWNLAVYLGMAVHAVGAWSGASWLRPTAGLTGSLVRWLTGPARLAAAPGSTPATAAAIAWARLGAPLALVRAAALLHAAAAALALGLVAGLYLRGLVLDIRAGWQSTFLDAATVQAWLAAALAPASMLTGIGVPDTQAVAALRVGATGVDGASAAPWIHLYAAMLALLVIAPRAVLASAALLKARWHASHVRLPLADPYFQRLLREQRGEVASVQVLPHAAAPGAQAALGLRAVLAGSLGPTLQLRVADVTAFGDEDLAGQRIIEPGTTLRVALFDLGATPEPDSQGRFVLALQRGAPTLPLLMVVDESAYARRFGALADRMAERRAGWLRLATGLGCGLLCVNLEQPDPASTGPALARALSTVPRAAG